MVWLDRCPRSSAQILAQEIVAVSIVLYEAPMWFEGLNIIPIDMLPKLRTHNYMVYEVDKTYNKQVMQALQGR